MIQKTFIDKIPAKIVAETCGTAMQKTITVKVNAEMGLEDAKQLITEIDNAMEWLKHAKKNCEACDHYGDCLERDPE
jgi:deferrochelatase/peroxidase EfeB